MTLAETHPALHPDDPDDEWIVESTGRMIRLRALTGVLVVLVVLAGGFWGGVVAEKHHGSGTSANSSLAAALRTFAGRTGTGSTRTGSTGATGSSGASGFSGFGGASSAATGTVVGVQGNVLEVSTSDGNLVKVDVAPSVTVTRTDKSSLSALQIGDTVVVAGATGSDGTVTATSVRATAPGVTTTGGFGGGGFGGAGGFGGTGGTGAASGG